MSFPNLDPTNEGKAAMLSVIEGRHLAFTRVGLGNGTRPESIDDLTEMQNRICYGDITSYTRDGIFAILHWQLDTARINSEFYWTEYALYAVTFDGFDSDNNKINPSPEFLFSYAYDDDKPQPLSATISASLGMIETDLNITIGSAQNIHAVIGEYSAYASKEVVENHLDDKNNPHEVTKGQLGLENVENVSVNNAKPTIDEESVPSELTNISNGDNVKTLWGKVKKAISVLAAHISPANKNPHKMEPVDIGAAPSSHTHNVTDINAGILPIARGGTGGNSAYNALKALITDAAQHIYLASGKYIIGKGSDGKNYTCCGLWSSGETFLGHDEHIAHVHGKSICMRVTDDNGKTYNYWNISAGGTLYPSDTGVHYLGSSSHRIRTIYATNALNTSDKKLKENVIDCEIGLAILEKLAFKEFNFIGDNEVCSGLIAQEVFEVFQELGIHNSGAYSAAVKGNDPEKHPERENLTDEQILSYSDKDLVWSLNYQVINNYCMAGLKQYMRATDSRLEALENRLKEEK